MDSPPVVATAPFGLRVRTGVVPDPPGEVVATTTDVVVDGDRVWAADPGSWSLLVEGGRDVVVDWRSDGPVPDWLVTSWAVSLAMLQRGHLCLHASLVRIGERVLCVAGVSGAGKSTAVLGLHDRGHPVLVDDVVVVDRPERAARAWVFDRSVLVPEATRAALGWPVERMDGRDDASGKWRWTPPAGGGERTVVVDGVALLEVDAGVTAVTVEPVTGASRVGALLADAARPRTAGRVLGDAALFSAITQFAAAVDVVRVRRPADGWSGDAVVDALVARGQR